jgi:hypothetical protein
MSRNIHGFKVRGLTRKECRELREYGFFNSYYFPPMNDLNKCDEGIENVMDLCVEDKIPDDISNKKYLDIFQKGILIETYGSKDEEKNLKTSGNGTQTNSE